MEKKRELKLISYKEIILPHKSEIVKAPSGATLW
jgi:hypothetical protein